MKSWELYVAVIFNVLGQLSMKHSMLKLSSMELKGVNSFLALLFAPFTILGLMLYGLSTIFWLLSLRKVELSVAYPTLSLGYVLIYVSSILLFNEPFKWVRFLGILLILIGVVLISR
ncbi:MAG: SMR family transporter [candidate division WOR-3 bacterium]